MKIKGNYFTTSDGVYLYYEDYGEGQPLVLLPGSNCSTEFFNRNVRHLKDHMRVITIDMRGHGRSQKTMKGNSLSQHAEDIHELFEHLDLHDVILGGWSLSGATVVRYCHNYASERLSGILLMDTVLYPFSSSSFNTYRYRDHDIDGWLKDRMHSIYNPEIFLNDFVERMSDMSTEEDKAWMKTEVSKTLPTANLELHFDYCMQNTEEELGLIDIPIGLFYAKSKHYGVGYVEAYEEIAQAPTYSALFEKGGHMAFYFDSDYYNQQILSFVQWLSELNK